MGPVIPLTGTPKDKEKDSDNLLGSSGSNPIQGDAIATKVLAKGEEWLPRPAVPIILRGQTAVKPSPPRLRQKLQLWTSPSQRRLWWPSQRLRPQ